MTEGFEIADVGGAQVRVFNIAKTVADCFKFRNKIGLDVALEALREAWNDKRATIDDLWRYAEICRVANVMRPYLEAVGPYESSESWYIGACTVAESHEGRQDSLQPDLDAVLARAAVVPFEPLALVRSVIAEGRTSLRPVVRPAAPADP